MYAFVGDDCCWTVSSSSTNTRLAALQVLKGLYLRIPNNLHRLVVMACFDAAHAGGWSAWHRMRLTCHAPGCPTQPKPLRSWGLEPVVTQSLASSLPYGFKHRCAAFHPEACDPQTSDQVCVRCWSGHVQATMSMLQHAASFCTSNYRRINSI